VSPNRPCGPKKALSRISNLPLERVETSPHASLIDFVGEGIGHTHGIAARVFRAVTDLGEAVRAVHREFFGNGSKRPGSPPSALPPAASPAA
jgi:hypothetical protein